MRRFFVILGIVLMVFAFAILTVFIIAPAVFTLDNAPFLKSILQAAACNTGEELNASYSTYSTPGTTTRTTHMSCVNSEGQERDISGQIIGVGAIGYLVPFLVGLFMTIIAASREKIPYSVKSNFNKRTNVDVHSTPAVVHVPLAQRLQELKDAYNAGLITEAEYASKRSALLNE